MNGYVLSNGGPPWRLLTYWKNQAAFAQASANIAKHIGDLNHSGTATVKWQGLYRDSTLVDRPPLNWGKLVTVAFGVCSFLALVVTNLLWILDSKHKLMEAFSGPQVDMVKADDVLRLPVGKDFDAKFEVRNTSPFSTADVDLSGVTFQPEQGSPDDGLDVHPLVLSRFGGMKPTTKEPFKVSGKALKPGTYRLVVKGTGRAGEIEKQIGLEATINVEVWPVFDTLGKRSIISATDHACVVRVELQIGERHQKGAELLLLIRRTPAVQFGGVSTAPHPDIGANPAKGAEVARMQWTTGALERMEPHTFNVYLTSDTPQADATWRDIMTKMELKYSRIPD